MGRGRGHAPRGGVCAWRDIVRRLDRPLGRLRPMGAERRRRQATNGSDYCSSAREREPGAAPSPPRRVRFAGYCALVIPAVSGRLWPMGAERRRRQATNGSDYRSSAREREPGAAPSPRRTGSPAVGGEPRQQPFKRILTVETCVDEPARRVVPIGQTAIIKRFF